jgi:hypothetical protein
MSTQAEILAAARQIVSEHDSRKPRNTNLPDPAHRGVVEANYVRPQPSEFPRMVYRADANEKLGYRTRIVKSQEEQDALPKGWLTSVADIHALLDPLAKKAYAEPEEAPAPAEAAKKSK